MSIIKKILKIDDSATNNEIKKMSERSKFSKYLPWIAYDPEKFIYINQDDTAGFIFECFPLAFASLQTVDILEGLLRLDVPEGSILQFILFADPEITHYLNSYLSQKTRNLDVLQESAIKFTDYLYNGIKGLEKISNIPIRNYRLFVTLKFPIKKWDSKSYNIEQLQSTTKEILKGARLYPTECEVDILIDFLRRIFDNNTIHKFYYDENIPINKQIINAETIIEKNKDMLKIGNNYFKCISPKIFPKEVSIYQTNQLFGGVMGLRSDMDQIITPYLYTLNIVYENLKTRIHTKCSLLLQQQSIGSFAPSLNRKKDEYLWATDELEKGTKFFRVMPLMWIFSNDEKTTIECTTKVKRMWEQQGYIMQEDKMLLDILFISSLPFGLYNIKENIEMIERDFITPSLSIAPIMPVQADFAGGGTPRIIFIGRKGQICSLSLFDKSANNANGLVIGTTGSGKSFFVNYLTINEYANNSMIRIIDIGGSYKKLVKLCNARYLDFSPESNICVNPFTNVRDIDIDLPAIKSIVSQMVYSQSDDYPDEIEETIIKNSVYWAFLKEQNNATIDDIYYFLKTYPRHASEEIEELKAKENIIEKAHKLAFNLKEFTSEGSYGKYFIGKSEFDISNDEFVVLELEHLTGRLDLFKVMTKLIINSVTQDLYLSDRSRNRLIIFDEFWQYGKGKLLKETVEGAYRRVRKYGGGIIIVTQSILDIKQFEDLGNVLLANSAFKFFLESPVLLQAKEDKLIDYDDFTFNILKTTQSNRPKYSEIFIDSPFGKGVVRLVVDPFSYFLYTSDAKEVYKIEKLMEEHGLSYREAILHLLKEQQENITNA